MGFIMIGILGTFLFYAAQYAYHSRESIWKFLIQEKRIYIPFCIGFSVYIILNHFDPVGNLVSNTEFTNGWTGGEISLLNQSVYILALLFIYITGNKIWNAILPRKDSKE